MIVGPSEFTDRRTYTLETMSGPLSAPWPLSLEVGESWSAYFYHCDPLYRYPRGPVMPDLTVRVYWEYGEQSLLRHKPGLDYQIVILISCKDGVAILERVLRPSLSKAEMLAKEAPEAYRSLFAITLLEAVHRKGWKLSNMYVYQGEPFRETRG